VLAAGRWPLAAGRWPLVAGRWSLVRKRWQESAPELAPALWMRRLCRDQ